MSTMRLEVMEEWCRELESGKIPQGTKRLAVNDRRCCLGVLCDIAVRHGVIPPPREITEEIEGLHTVLMYGDEEDLSSTMLPQAVTRWAGFDPDFGPSEESPLGKYPEDPRVDLDGVGRESENLATLNDEGWAFPEIAAAIRRTYGGSE